ncbi:MAG: tRNA epoxyqueuosine(34) reductase QueG [Bacteroidales bacterium]|jgi:epoxyqueuosine reductase|nr:tRNA epoxyqueuosine(34) reductase QueG [Bacteroidales bacterium]
MPLKAISKSDLSALIIAKAIDLGFSDCGISAAAYLAKEEDNLNKWLEEGRHGLMGYMERNKEKRLDPRLLVPQAKSIISVLQNYYPKEIQNTDNNYKISKYAYGDDYHDVITRKLLFLANEIIQYHPEISFRVFVDSAPVMDRVWAKKSGLGWIGKNSMLINRKGGSFFFIGHIILDLELIYNSKQVKDYCANCSRCIDACPTQAIYEARKIDARKCLSYQTIEVPKLAERSNPDLYQDWIFGCDICQDVCPWNDKFIVPHVLEEFVPKPEIMALQKEDWNKLTEMQFGDLFRGSAVKRAKYSGLKQTIQWVNKKE